MRRRFASSLAPSTEHKATRMMRRAAFSCALTLILTGCAGASVPPSTAALTVAATTAVSTATPRPSAAASPTSTPRPACPNPTGGQCLGVLPAGTYSTVRFGPTITYIVPAGWENSEDLSGNFALLPPGNDIAGVDAGTSDYIGVYASIAPHAPCGHPVLDIHGAAAMAAYMRGQAAYATTAARPASVGGLSGVVLDIRLAPTWKKACVPGAPDAFLITGVTPSDFDHGLVGKLAIRLYLLDRGTNVLAIEVDDVSGGGHLDGYDVVVKSLQFGSP